MTYDPTIPKADVSPKDSATPMRGNFSDYQTVFSINHTAINNSNQGKHEAVILKKQSIDPGVNNNYDVLFCKDATSNAGTQPQLFAQIPQFLPNQIPNTPMQLTYNQVINSGVTTPSSTSAYQSFLIGGYLIFSNITSVNHITGTLITLTPAPTKILCVVAQHQDFSQITSYSAEIKSNNTFLIKYDEIQVFDNSFNWIAICKV